MKDETKPTNYRQYDAEFKAKLLKMHENGRSIASLADSFGVPVGTLYAWRKSSTSATCLPIKEDSSELKQLRRQLAEVKEERDILKKALAIFSRLA